MRAGLGLSLAVILLAAPVLAGGAAGPFAGRWIIESGVPAPWADARARAEQAEKNSLVGKRVTIAEGKIRGPGILNCSDGVFAIKSYDADMLFQGSLKDPLKEAAALGFGSGKIQTLETGCANEIDFHLNASGKIEFAINDFIYTLGKK